MKVMNFFDNIRPLFNGKLKITKKIAVIAVAAVVAVAVIAVIFAVNTGKKYNPEGFNATVYKVDGGENLTDVNLTDIIFDYPDENKIKISLMLMAQGENKIPKYTVDFLQTPLRMRITLSGISYWDYIVNGVPEDESGIVSGMFRQSPSDENGDTVLYFNFACDVKFNVCEENGCLSVTFERSEKDSNKNGAYIVADMYYEYQTGLMPDESLTPTLSSDGVSVVTVSRMYSSIEEAEKAKAKFEEGAYANRELRIVESDRFALIPFWQTSDTLAQLNESVLSVDGAKTTLTPYFTDARFLCLLPENNGLFAKTENGVEKLYVADRDGTRHALTERTFATVVKATVSADGKVIAFTEHADEIDLLTVIFTETDEIKVVATSEEIGSIGAIELNGDGSMLYCLSGDETYTLTEYPVADGEKRILSENMITETELFYYGGYLYYCDVVEEYEAIVRNYVKDNTREVIAKGSQFAVSADGNVVAVVKEDYDTAVCDLNIVNISEQTEETVYSDVVLSEFFISSDNGYLYYVVETGDSEFYYQIMRYNVENKEISAVALSVNASFFASDRPEEIVISLTYTDDNEERSVTYIADFVKINEAVKKEQIEQTEQGE